MNRPFCTKCGIPLRFIARQTDEFDPIYGRRLYNYEFVCPNREFFWDGHNRIGAPMGIRITEKYFPEFQTGDVITK